MHKTYNPATVAAATGYSHGVELAHDVRVIYTAGQLGVAPDGSMAPDIKGQSEQAWRNLQSILTAAGMGLENLVKINSYITRKEDLAGYRDVRSKVLGNLKPASTLVIISALARDGALVEIEAVAAK